MPRSPQESVELQGQASEWSWPWQLESMFLLILMSVSVKIWCGEFRGVPAETYLRFMFSISRFSSAIAAVWYP